LQEADSSEMAGAIIFFREVSRGRKHGLRKKHYKIKIPKERKSASSWWIIKTQEKKEAGKKEHKERFKD